MMSDDAVKMFVWLGTHVRSVTLSTCGAVERVRFAQQ